MPLGHGMDMFGRLLKEGGVWINFGPLLYHWAQSSTGDTDDRYRREYKKLTGICVFDENESQNPQGHRNALQERHPGDAQRGQPPHHTTIHTESYISVL